MSSESREFWTAGIYRLMRLQAVAAAVVSLGLLAAGGRWAAGAAFGSMLALLNGYLLARRIERAGSQDPRIGEGTMYAGAVYRFILVLLALAAAYGLGLHLLAVALGFFVVQATAFFATLRTAQREAAQLRKGGKVG